jgi:alpha/beta superfamily hydrolase
MNFRGVGQSAGTHDAGIGETDDMALLLAHMRARYPALPLALAGFSFGTFRTSLSATKADTGRHARRTSGVSRCRRR